MKLGLIYARARNGVIGIGNTLPWRLPEDMAHFKATTLGCPVIMGRKTWDSLPPKFRPLPGRPNIVVTRDVRWQAEGALSAPGLEPALALCGDAPQAWVIGGAEIYRLALPLAHIAEVTEIEADFPGDAYAPELGPAWVEVARHEQTSAATGLRFSFVTYHNSHIGD